MLEAHEAAEQRGRMESLSPREARGDPWGRLKKQLMFLPEEPARKKCPWRWAERARGVTQSHLGHPKGSPASSPGLEPHSASLSQGTSLGCPFSELTGQKPCPRQSLF